MYQFHYLEVSGDGYGIEGKMQDDGSIDVWMIDPPNEGGRQSIGKVNTVQDFIDKYIEFRYQGGRQFIGR